MYVCVCVCCTCTLMSHTEITERCWQEECSVLIAVCATHMCYRYITNKAKNLRALHHPHTKGCACGDTLTHTHTNTHTNTRAYGHAGVAHIAMHTVSCLERVLISGRPCKQIGAQVCIASNSLITFHRTCTCFIAHGLSFNEYLAAQLKH